MNWYAFGIVGACQFGRVGSFCDSWDLCCGEGYDFVLGIIAVKDVEVVEVSACRAHYDDFLLHRASHIEVEGWIVFKDESTVFALLYLVYVEA